MTRDWHDRSSYLILLSVENEDALLDWADVVHHAGVPHSIMVEPDLGGEHTSIAVAPSVLGERFSSLPLLGRELAVS